MKTHFFEKAGFPFLLSLLSVLLNTLFFTLGATSLRFFYLKYGALTFWIWGLFTTGVLGLFNFLS